MSTDADDATSVASASTTIEWDPAARIASVRYARGASLEAADGAFLVDALTRWIGAGVAPFGVLADAAGLRETDGRYRSHTSKFFRRHRDHGFIALTNLGPVIHIVVELFRLGTGIPLKTFADEAAARTWLRAKGIAA